MLIIPLLEGKKDHDQNVDAQQPRYDTDIAYEGNWVSKQTKCQARGVSPRHQCSIFKKSIPCTVEKTIQPIAASNVRISIFEGII